MDVIKEHNDKYQLFADITGEAMKVHNKFRSGLLESAYEAGLKYLLEKKGHTVERQVPLPIYWDEVQLDQSYRMDLVVDGVIIELKAVGYVSKDHRRQLWNYLNLTHTRYGMLINFGNEKLYTEWFERDARGHIEKVELI